MISKSCFNCVHCYDRKECVLRDDLILGYCFMWKLDKNRVVIE